MLITTSEASSLAVLSDSMITIDASSKTTRSDASVQPMGNLFEQSTAILLDIIVLCLMEKHGISSDDIVPESQQSGVMMRRPGWKRKLS
ncbi:MAG: hypothetical protein ACLR0U_19085 [Enterocloster clostridioformis]